MKCFKFCTSRTEYFPNLFYQVHGPNLNTSTVRGPGELRTVVVTNLTAFTRYFVTVTAFTGPLEHAASDGKAIGPIEFQTLEEGKWNLHSSCCPCRNMKKVLEIIICLNSVHRTQGPSQKCGCISYSRGGEPRQGDVYPT